MSYSMDYVGNKFYLFCGEISCILSFVVYHMILANA